MSLGLLFPGQGSQHPDMLRWLWREADARDALGRIGRSLGDDWAAQLGDSAWASRNAVAQPLLTGIALAAWDALRPLLPAPAAIAGYSVGELAAFAAAGVFDAETALRLAGERAARMDACLQGAPTGLLSVASAPVGLIDALCDRHGLAVAIRIDVDRAVVGGTASGLDAAEIDATTHGASCTRLPVGLASHTRWLDGAVDTWTAVLEGVAFQRPCAALVCNLAGVALQRPEALRDALARQIASPVEWGRAMQTLAERRVQCVLEVGPGSALARLWNARHPGVPARSVDEFNSARAAADWVLGMLEAGR